MQFVPADPAAEDWEADVPLLRTHEIGCCSFRTTFHSNGDSLKSPSLEG